MRINQRNRILSSRFNQTITVESKDGTAFTTLAIVIPVSPQDLMLLPEGERTTPTVKVYTKTKLNLGDLVVVNGERWRITTADDWGAYGYFNNRATRLVSTQKGYSNGFKFNTATGGG